VGASPHTPIWIWFNDEVCFIKPLAWQVDPIFRVMENPQIVYILCEQVTGRVSVNIFIPVTTNVFYSHYTLPEGQLLRTWGDLYKQATTNTHPWGGADCPCQIDKWWSCACWMVCPDGQARGLMLNHNNFLYKAALHDSIHGIKGWPAILRLTQCWFLSKRNFKPLAYKDH
jgi:hypothetical protein